MAFFRHCLGYEPIKKNDDAYSDLVEEFTRSLNKYSSLKNVCDSDISKLVKEISSRVLKMAEIHPFDDDFKNQVVNPLCSRIKESRVYKEKLQASLELKARHANKQDVQDRIMLVVTFIIAS